MTPATFHEQYRQLQRYVGWTDDDARRVAAAHALLAPSFPRLVDDFYEEIERHPEARRVIRDAAQVERLKRTLDRWLHELMSGATDRAYLEGRWRVGLKHVEIGLSQVYTNVALSRLRSALQPALAAAWTGPPDELLATLRSLNLRMDLDLAIIENAYQAAHIAQQEKSARLATIGQVAGGIAHELRNPLNTLKTSAYFLRKATNIKPEKLREHLERIDRQVNLADRVITTLTDFARLPLPTFVPVTVAEVLAETVATNPAPENVRVRIDVPTDLPRLNADPAQLGIALDNLVRNACDAMPEGGELTLVARAVGDEVELRVQDTGVGIPPENLGRIMEPLFSTKARGIGLGLAITKAILDKHGATVTVTSELGRGTTFAVTLPCAASPKSAGA